MSTEQTGGLPVTRRRCGTVSGWSGHQERDERPCDACATAKREYDQRRRAAPAARLRSRLSARAEGRAATRLRAAHPEEWARYYAEAKDELSRESQDP